MYNQLMVLSDPVKGREDEYNDWYTWVHIRDVMRLSPAMIATQRFCRAARQIVAPASSPYQQGHLAFYENSDPVRLTADHAPMMTDEMPISSAFDQDAPIAFTYYDQIAAKTSTPGEHSRADVIAEWINPSGSAADFMKWYGDVRFPALTALPGVVSGCFTKASTDQQPGSSGLPAFTAIYRTTDLDKTAQAWQALSMAWPAACRASDASVGCFTPLTPRVTRIQVVEPDDVSRETARQKRAALGDRVHRLAKIKTG